MTKLGTSDGKVGLRVVHTEVPEKVTQENIYEWFKDIRNKDKLVASDEAIKLIQESFHNPEFDGFRFIDTLITYQSVLDCSQHNNLEDYINAIRFCSYLESNGGNATDAYAKAFSHREFVRKALELGDRYSNEWKNLSSAAARYRKNPLVVKILTQAEVPLYLMFQGARYKAVGVLVNEMENAALSRDKINAANAILTHLKPPEGVKIELDIGMKKDNVVNEYETMLETMVRKQRELLLAGEQLGTVANSRLNYVDVNVEDKGDKDE